MIKHKIFSIFSILSLLSCTVFLTTSSYAQSGYRICGVLPYNRGDRLLQKGLAVKVSVDNGGNTCQKKIDFMTKYFSNAYPGEQGKGNLKMITCEDFSQHMGKPNDMCYSMEVNKIYKYQAKFNNQSTLNFWHN